MNYCVSKFNILIKSMLYLNDCCFDINIASNRIMSLKEKKTYVPAITVSFMTVFYFEIRKKVYDNFLQLSIPERCTGTSLRHIKLIEFVCKRFLVGIFSDFKFVVKNQKAFELRTVDPIISNTDLVLYSIRHSSKGLLALHYQIRRPIRHSKKYTNVARIIPIHGRSMFQICVKKGVICYVKLQCLCGIQVDTDNERTVSLCEGSGTMSLPPMS